MDRTKRKFRTVEDDGPYKRSSTSRSVGTAVPGGPGNTQLRRGLRTVGDDGPYNLEEFL